MAAISGPICSCSVAARQTFTPLITLPELRKYYTNSINMELVRVKDGFYVGRFEISQQEYQRVMNRPAASARKPVVLVNWADARAFCERLTQLDAESARRARLAGWTYTLPNETEWARFTEADPEQLLEAVFQVPDLQPKESDPARKSRNRAGLYDLFGNVAEWCFSSKNQPITLGGN